MDLRYGTPIVGAIIALAAPGVLLAQRTAVEKDSVGIQMAAVFALRQFQYQYGNVVGGQREVRGLGVCEIRVADFCYGPLNGRTAWNGISTYPAQATLAPSRLHRMWRRNSEFYISRYMNELQRHQRAVPNDRWINAELVRMHIDHGYLGRAEAAVTRCRDTTWWCAALSAYVMHTTGAWQRADSAWSLVLSSMTPEERCEWLDPSPVISDKKLRTELRDFTCSERVEFSARFWWLSDPMFSRPGNERRSAHLSRTLSVIVDAATQDRVMATPAMVRAGRVATLDTLAPVSLDKPMLMKCADFGGDNPASGRRGIILLMLGWPELVTRVGVPVYCGGVERDFECEPPMSCPPPPQFTQYPLSRMSLVPQAEAARDHLKSLATDWQLRDPRAYEFISGFTNMIQDLTYQAAHFSRSDSSRLVIAAELPVVGNDGIARPATYQTRAELWLQRDFDEPPVRATTTGTTRIFFDRLVAPERTLASIESDHSRGPLGRVRFATGPQPMPVQRVTLSDLLLLEDGAQLPTNLEQAGPRARTNTTVRVGSNIGVFWEVYGLRPGERPNFSILVVRQDGREPVRLGRGLQRAAVQDVVSTSWDEPPVAGAVIEPRSINVSLGTLRRGVYTISVAVQAPGQELVESVRTIEILR